MLKFFVTHKGEDDRKEVTYIEALHILLGSYKDNDMTREMLAHDGVIPTMFSIVEVVSQSRGGDGMK